MSIKIFHVKIIINLKIFWTKTVNNIELLNFITKNPLLILISKARYWISIPNVCYQNLTTKFIYLYQFHCGV